MSSELHNLIRVGRQMPSAESSGGLPPSPDDLRRRFEQQERLRAGGELVRSPMRLAVTAASYPLTVHQIWNTGLPRNDFILRAEDELPADLASRAGPSSAPW